MTDSARMMLTLRRTATATELLVTATVSTAIKLPPSQLHVERKAPVSPVFFLTMKGSQLYTAKDAVRKFLRMYQDSSSSLYSSSTSRAIFAGSEIEVVKYVPSATPLAPQITDRPLPALAPLPINTVPQAQEDLSQSSFTFRGPPRREAQSVPPPSSPPARKPTALSQWSSSVLAIRATKPSMTVETSKAVAVPFRRRPSLTTWFSDKVTLKPVVSLATPAAESPAPVSPRKAPAVVARQRSESRLETKRQESPPSKEGAPAVVKRSSSSIRMKSPVRAVEEDDEEEEDPFPKPALRGKVGERKPRLTSSGSNAGGNFSVLSEAAKKVEKSDLSASEFSTASARKSVAKRQSSIWEDEEWTLDDEEAAEKEQATEESAAESSTGWSWLWGGDDSEDQSSKQKAKRRKSRR